MRGSRAAVFLVAALVSAASSARGDDAVHVVRVEEHANGSCPGGVFAARLFARLPGWRAAADGERALEIDATIEGAGRAARGTLAIRDPHGDESTREVGGGSCATVVDALVLVAAMALESKDATALKEGAKEQGATSSSSAPSSTSQDAANAAAEDVKRKAAAAKEAAAETRSEDRVAWSPQPSTQAGLHVALASTIGVDAALAPSAVPTFHASAELERASDGWSPVARLGYLHADSGTIETFGSGARFVSNFATLDLCPQRLAGARLYATACVRIEAGALDASATKIVDAHAAHRAWFATDIVLTTRYSLGPVPLLFVDLDAGLRVPFTRDHFYFEPNRPVFRAAAVGSFAALGIGVTIP